MNILVLTFDGQGGTPPSCELTKVPTNTEYQCRLQTTDAGDWELIMVLKKTFMPVASSEFIKTAADMCKDVLCMPLGQCYQ